MSGRKTRSIAYLTHYFPPEVNAPAIRISNIARLWASRGHRVTVMTGFPNHPNGIIPKEYRGRLRCKERRDGYDVIRTFVYAAANKGFFRRVLNYLSFLLSSILLGLPSLPKVDAVVASSPQFFVAVAGYVISVLKRARFVFEVRDVWPEEIVAVGAVRNRMVIRMLEAVEMFLYRRADLIVAVAQGTVDILTSRGVPREKITLMPNGVDLDDFSASVDTAHVRGRHNLNGEFLVSYIGTHGMAHRLQTVVDAAAELKSNNRIKFLMVGDGAEKKLLEGMVKEHGLDNIQFAPQTTHAGAIEYYFASDACLVPLRRASLFTKNIPSKIYEIMASGKPILLGAEGESRKLVLKAMAGLAFEPENHESLAESIEKLFHDRELARKLGRNGREFARNHCQRTKIADSYLEKIESLA